eukprot:319182_1
MTPKRGKYAHRSQSIMPSLITPTTDDKSRSKSTNIHRNKYKNDKKDDDDKKQQYKEGNVEKIKRGSAIGWMWKPFNKKRSESSEEGTGSDHGNNTP